MSTNYLTRLLRFLLADFTRDARLLLADFTREAFLVRSEVAALSNAIARQRRAVSVLLIGQTKECEDIYASWSGELASGEARQVRFELQRLVRVRWLVGLNGALLEHIIVGDELHDCIHGSLGPVARLDAVVQPGLWLVVTVRAEVSR